MHISGNAGSVHMGVVMLVQIWLSHDCAVLLIGIEYIKLMIANYVIYELQVWKFAHLGFHTCQPICIGIAGGPVGQAVALARPIF